FPALAGGHGWEDRSGWSEGQRWDGDQDRGEWREGPPPCREVEERWSDGQGEDGWVRRNHGCAQPEEVSLPASFFEGGGGVGPDGSVYDTGGGGGFVESDAFAGAHAFAFASARASVSVSVRFHGGFHHPMMHHGGCGCARH
ncbi:MAG: hypothetical protein ACHP7N_19190, partial [Caulobacterales bacterium]